METTSTREKNVFQILFCALLEISLNSSRHYYRRQLSKMMCGHRITRCVCMWETTRSTYSGNNDVCMCLMNKKKEKKKMSKATQYNNNNNNKRVQYVLTHALLHSNTKDDCSRNLMTSSNWQKNDVEKGKRRRRREGVLKNEEKKWQSIALCQMKRCHRWDCRKENFEGKTI